MTYCIKRLVAPAVGLVLMIHGFAFAEPVTGWSTTNGDAGYSSGSELTNSPVTTSAADDTIAGSFGAVTLEDGDTLELTGSVSLDVPLVGNQFRWGLFNGASPVVTGQGSGYVGYWVNAPTTSNPTTSWLVSANGSLANPFSGGASTNLVLGTGTAYAAPASTVLNYVLRITREDTNANVFASLTDGNTYNITWVKDDAAASPASFTYNTAAFLLGGTLNGNVATFSDVNATLTKFQSLTLEVNTDTGLTKIINNSDRTFEMNSYEILSANGSLDLSGWTSLDQQNIDAVDGPDGGDTAGDSIGEGWDAAPLSGLHVLSEAFLTGKTTIDIGESLDLGLAFSDGQMQDLKFNFTELGVSEVFKGKIKYVSGIEITGDYNGDGVVNAADYVLWRDTLGSISDLAADGNDNDVIDDGDYVIWKSNFGNIDGEGASAQASAVPEPTLTALLLAIVGTGALRRMVIGCAR